MDKATEKKSLQENRKVNIHKKESNQYSQRGYGIEKREKSNCGWGKDEKRLKEK